MATEELFRHDGAPLERNHLRDMVQRNALENTAFNKVAKHLETQKKAFVRQNTRNEGELKHLLYRLQNEQQTTLEQPPTPVDDEILSDSDDELVLDDIYNEPVETVSHSNPYPVTIIPRFGGAPYVKNTPKPSTNGNRPGSTSRQHSRRKSIEYEDMQESLSMMTVSRMPSTNSVSDQASSPPTGSHDDWLASPDAISSVRRLRKSVEEQAHRKIVARTNSDILSRQENGCRSFTSSPSHSRNNSLKDKKRHDNMKDELSSPRNSIVSRRGGSLKERKRTVTTDDVVSPRIKPIARSFSMLTKTSLAEFNQRQERKNARQLSDRKLETETACTNGGDKTCSRAGSVKEKKTSARNTEQYGHATRKDSKKGSKSSLCRKSSNESCTSNDDVSPRRAPCPRRKLGVAHNTDSSPNISPLTKEGISFKY